MSSHVAIGVAGYGGVPETGFMIGSAANAFKINRSASGAFSALAKVGFETYFLQDFRRRMHGIDRLKPAQFELDAT